MKAEISVRALSIEENNGQAVVRLELTSGKMKAETTITVNCGAKEAEQVAKAQALRDAELHLKGASVAVEGSKDNE